MHKHSSAVPPVSALSVIPRLSVLSDGVRVVSDTVPHVRTFALGIWIDCGSRDDTIPGIAHMLEHVLFRRSQRYTGTERARMVESLGAYLNASTSKEQTCYYVRGLAEHFERLADLLIELVFAPAFTATDVEKERRIILEELRAYDDDPEEVVCDHLEAVLFGSHPLAHPIAGDIESIQRITDHALWEFYQRWYVGSRCAIIVSGPFDHDSVVGVVERLLRRWNVPAGTSVGQVRRYPLRVETQRAQLQRSFQQAHLAYGIHTESAKSPLRHALALLNILVGDSTSSRLYRRIRERRALAYTVYSWLHLLSDCGELAIYASTHPANATAAAEAIEEEITRLRVSPPTAAEFRRAREQLRASLIMSTESLSARVQSIARMLFDEEHLDSLESSIAAIERVSLVEVQELAATVADSTRWSSVICF